MGQLTSNMSIYVPANGETNYGQSFLAGMLNIDNHDHSGPPFSGVPISTAGLAPNSVTFDKLNANVADTTTGIGTNGNPGFQNQLQILGLLKSIYQNSVNAGFQAILNSNQPAFSAGHSGSQSIPSGGTYTTVTFTDLANPRLFQQGANYASNTFTCPVAGVYIFIANIELGAVTNPGDIFVKFLVTLSGGGTADYLISSMNGNAIITTTNDYLAGGTQIMKCLAGDTIKVQVSNNTVGNITVFSGSFSGVLLC